MNMKKAVCILLWDSNHKCLLVTRPYQTQVGLPGGKINEGETPEEAIHRELWEETGLYINKENLILIYTGNNKNDGHDIVEVSTFLSFKWFGQENGHEQDRGIFPYWGNYQELITNSPYVDYNKNLAQKIVEKFPYLKKYVGEINSK